MILYLIPTVLVIFSSIVKATSINGNTNLIKRPVAQENVTKIDPENDVSAPDLHIYICTINSSENDAAIAENLLDSLIERLKSFVNETSFDDFGFETLAHSIREQMTYIGTSIDPTTPCDRELAKKLRFARFMFRIMDDSVLLLKFFDPLRGQDQTLVYKVIILNIRLLVFYNDLGEPNYSMKGYEKKINNLNRTLHSWGEVFRGLEKTALSVTVMFETQFSHALFTLQELISHISRIG